LKTARLARQIPIAEAFANGSLCLVAGSTWPKDEELLARFINQSPQHAKFIIAPHEIKEDQIARLEAAINEKHMRYSRADSVHAAQAKVMIIDNIGMLSSLYRYGQIAYVGGGFGKGIHNILEAAVYGIPVVIGPEHSRFREAHDLIREGAAFPVANEAGFMNTLQLLTENKELRQKASFIAARYVKQHAGATNTLLDAMLPKLTQLRSTFPKPTQCA
jgi:3-deoxy-D-manno-octulosonic-acid transferase